MNAPRYEPHRPRRTQTFWPVTRRPEPPSRPATHETSRDDNKDDEHAHDEPGYGHGV
jgi:hypothetical protein